MESWQCPIYNRTLDPWKLCMTKYELYIIVIFHIFDQINVLRVIQGMPFFT